ncbi:hypothetical protein HELRODRAFT_165303 [Helobdella robusta]|uniref:Uncharacterized protein n=1 Tax=Helobdella robusta TaxID=6412 RepID=T1EWK5_HELRO|nr:hypothetical protein HELRODRAFT_165303 [Helobdella robusta]ESN91298.1 hypothetical protein HELRODRAFT_165303 [Helobdella robusta]
MRYVLPGGPVERFLTFINIFSHIDEQLALYLTDFLEKQKIDIGLCRASLTITQLCTTLEEIQFSENEKVDTRNTAKDLNNSLHLLETGILCEMWNGILQAFNKCTISLQSSQIDISTAVALLKSLQIVIQSIRDNFDMYEQRGVAKTRNSNYKTSGMRKKKNKYDNASFENFIPITDKLMQELSNRITAYENIKKKPITE